MVCASIWITALQADFENLNIVPCKVLSGIYERNICTIKVTLLPLYWGYMLKISPQDNNADAFTWLHRGQTLFFLYHVLSLCNYTRLNCVIWQEVVYVAWVYFNTRKTLQTLMNLVKCESKGRMPVFRRTNGSVAKDVIPLELIPARSTRTCQQWKFRGAKPDFAQCCSLLTANYHSHPTKGFLLHYGRDSWEDQSGENYTHSTLQNPLTMSHNEALLCSWRALPTSQRRLTRFTMSRTQ